MANGEKKDAASEFSFDSVEDAHESIQEGSPLPNEPAIAAHGEEAAARIKATDGLTDSKGIKFNPAIHAVNSAGEPSKTPLGKFRARRGTSKVASQSVQIVEQRKKAEARAAGKLAADMMIGSSIMLLGPEWQPVGGKEVKAQDYDEREVLRNAFADYFEAKNWADFPPGIMLSVIVSSYCIPRLTAGKETKTRLKKARGWFGEKWENWKENRKNAAQSDTRDNGERKDDASKKDGETDETKGQGGDSLRPDA